MAWLHNLPPLSAFLYQVPEMAETRPVFWKLQATQMSIDLDLEEEPKEEPVEAEEKQPAPRSLARLGVSTSVLQFIDPGKIKSEVHKSWNILETSMRSNNFALDMPVLPCLNDKSCCTE
jgi:hypothetical protein